ncbi:hypothetical protein [Romboutsia sp.]|uniref:hypothetical protein n=1 Tax=Romboutsia sp. TaxID=1965302 RepID=UPI003F2C8940
MNSKKIKTFNYIMYIIYVFSIIYFAFNKNYSGAGLSTTSLVITFCLNKAYKKKIKPLDSSLYVVANLFVLFAIVLGSSYELYDKIKYYDDFLHFWSGFISVKIGWNLLNTIEVNPTKNKFIFFVIIFLFAMGISSIFEIGEFVLDTVFKMNTQAGGLKDTMQDMIDSLLGGLIMITYYFRKIK